MAGMNYITVSGLINNWASDLDLSGYSTPTLSGMISAASSWVDNVTNAEAGWDREQIVDEEYASVTGCHTNADGDLVIPLIKRPLANLLDVTDITIKKGAYNTHLTLTVGGVSVLHSASPYWSILYPNTWLVMTGTLLSNQRLYNLRSFGYSVKVTYTAGYDVIPDDIQYATALRTRSILAKQYNPMGAEQVKQGTMLARWSRTDLGEDSFTQEAKVFLKTYIRVV